MRANHHLTAFAVGAAWNAALPIRDRHPHAPALLQAIPCQRSSVSRCSAHGMTAGISAGAAFPFSARETAAPFGSMFTMSKSPRETRASPALAHEHLRKPFADFIAALAFSAGPAALPFALAFIDAGRHYTAVPKVFDIYRPNAGLRAKYPPEVVFRPSYFLLLVCTISIKSTLILRRPAVIRQDAAGPRRIGRRRPRPILRDDFPFSRKTENPSG